MKNQQRPKNHDDDSRSGTLESNAFDDWMDTENEESRPGRTHRLTWRGDPSSTFADWTIVVVTNELQSYTYHVHRSILSYGDRSSALFRRIMAKGAGKQIELSNSGNLPSTKVELDERELKAFPLMLDFIYSSPQTKSSSYGTATTANSTMSLSSSNEPGPSIGDGVIHAGNAVSLRHLATKFEVDSLTVAATKFIQKDFNIETGLRYVVSSHEYQDTRLFQSAIRLCLDNFTELDPKEITKLPFPIFRIFVRSFKSFREDDRDTSFFLSEVVCRYLERNRNFATLEILLELTDTDLMPCIAPEAAIGFTAIVKSLTPEAAKAHWDELVRLCRRCARAVVQEYGWNEFAVDGAVNEYLGHSVSVLSEVNCVDSLLFATSFAAALSQAQADYEDVESSQKSLSEMLTMLYQTMDTIEKANDRKDRYMAKQDASIAESRQRVRSLENEVRSLKQQLLRQKQLASHAQYSSSKRNIAGAGTPPRPTVSPLRAGKTGPQGLASRTSPSLNNEVTIAQDLSSTGLSNHQWEDPAIRDLVPPSSMLAEIRGRNAKAVSPNLTSKEQMRSISLV